MSIDTPEIRVIDDMDLDQMCIIWNQHVDTLTTSKLKVTPDGLANFRESHSEKEYLGYFDIRRSAQYLLGFVNVDTEEDNLYIHQIAVFEDVKRSNIGEKLLEHIKKLAIDHVNNIRLAVQVTNISALNFFLSQGFEIMGYSVETEYRPIDYDPSKIEDLIRLIEYKMEWNGP